jgi:GcrA cell cycle regulator
MSEEIEQVKTQTALEDDFAELEAEANTEADAAANDPVRKDWVTTISLTSYTCRWPFGDPATADFHYCGDLPLVGRPYCDKHDAQSYHAARPRKAAA